MVSSRAAAGRVVLSLWMLVLGCVAAEAATITFTATKTLNPEEYRWSNIDGTTLHVGVGGSSLTNILLPAFDPSFGTLVSARLEIAGGLLTTLFTHSGASLASVFTAASATGHATLSSVEMLFPTLNLYTEHPTLQAGDTRLFNPLAEVSGFVFETTAFNRTFTGASLSAFLAGPLGFVALDPHPDSYFHLSGAPGSLFYLPGDHSGHPAWFGDAHYDMTVRWDLSVIYTYEPLQQVAVPEPASLALLGAGLAGLAARRRHRSRVWR